MGEGKVFRERKQLKASIETRKTLSGNQDFGVAGVYMQAGSGELVLEDFVQHVNASCVYR